MITLSYPGTKHLKSAVCPMNNKTELGCYIKDIVWAAFTMHIIYWEHKEKLSHACIVCHITNFKEVKIKLS